jgi:hypothetical protein
MAIRQEVSRDLSDAEGISDNDHLELALWSSLPERQLARPLSGRAPAGDKDFSV